MNKWVNPYFWGHPTPVNLLLIVLVFVWLIALGILAVFGLVWLIDVLPWPVPLSQR